MRKLSIFIYLLSSFFLISCDDNREVFDGLATTRSIMNETTDYYWYKNEKMPLSKVPDKAFVLCKSTDVQNMLSAMKASYGISVDLSNSISYRYKEGALSNSKKGGETQYKWITVKINPEKCNLFDEVVYSAPFFCVGNSDPFPVTNIIYVVLKKDSDILLLQKLAKDYNVNIFEKESEFENLFYLECNKDSKGSALEIANELYEKELFEIVEPEFMSYRPYAFTNDPYYTQQWGLENTGQYGSSYTGIDIKYKQAVNSSLVPSTINTVVGVVDSGVELTHPDISLTSYSWNQITLSQSSIAYDSHGTMVGGVISGITNNSIGITGVGGTGVKVMSLSNGYSTSFLPADLAESIKKAANQGADVINLSWGGITPSSLISSAIYYVVNNGRSGRGCVVVCASGNLGSSSLAYPASYTPETSVISVGALSYNGSIWNASNYGTNLDLVAPGVNIPTTTTGSGYTTDSGTSLAAPHVSAVAAMMLAWSPNLNYDEVGFILQTTANKSLSSYTFSSTTKVGGTWEQHVGHGLLNMQAALSRAKVTSYNTYGNITFSGGQTNLNSGGSGYVGTSFTASYNSGYRYYWSGSYSGTCDRWFVTPNGVNSNVGNVSVYLNPGQSGTLAVTCRVYSNTAYIGKTTQYVYVSY